MPRILIVTGEASGDLHGANLANAIRALRPDTEVLGVGGSKMKAAGVTLIHGIERLDVVGVLGHPLLDAVAPSYERDELRKRFGFEAAAPVLGLLPGSREREVRILLPIMLQAAVRLARVHPGLQLAAAQASTIPNGLIEEVSAGFGVEVRTVRDQ